MKIAIKQINIKELTKNYLRASYKAFLSFLRLLKFDMVFAALYITALVSPTVSAFTRTKYGYPVVFAVYIVWFVSCILRARKRGKKFLIDKSRIAEVVAMVVWLITISLIFLSGRGKNGYWAIIYTIMFMTIYMIDYLYSIYNERYVLKGLMIVAMVIFAAHSLISIFMLAKDPLLARAFNAYYFKEIAKYAPLEYKGLGSYTFFTSLAIAIPIFIFMATKMKHRILPTILILLSVAGCFYAAYAGLIMMLIAAILLLLIYSFIFYTNKKQKRAMIAILILCIVLIINLFTWILPHDTNEMYKEKLRSLIYATVKINIVEHLNNPGEGPSDEAKSIEEVEGSRFEFYKLSLNTFIKNPLFGVGPYFKTETFSKGIGNHSSWLDYLAMYGLLGCAPLILFFILVFRRNIKMTNVGTTKVMRFTGWALFIGYGFLNPVFTAKNFPVVLMLLASGGVASGQLVKFKEVFNPNKTIK